MLCIHLLEAPICLSPIPGGVQGTSGRCVEECVEEPPWYTDQSATCSMAVVNIKIRTVNSGQSAQAPLDWHITLQLWFRPQKQHLPSLTKLFLQWLRHQVLLIFTGWLFFFSDSQKQRVFCSNDLTWFSWPKATMLTPIAICVCMPQGVTSLFQAQLQGSFRKSKTEFSTHSNSALLAGHAGSLRASTS